MKGSLAAAVVLATLGGVAGYTGYPFQSMTCDGLTLGDGCDCSTLVNGKPKVKITSGYVKGKDTLGCGAPCPVSGVVFNQGDGSLDLPGEMTLSQIVETLKKVQFKTAERNGQDRVLEYVLHPDTSTPPSHKDHVYRFVSKAEAKCSDDNGHCRWDDAQASPSRVYADLGSGTSRR